MQIASYNNVKFQCENQILYKIAMYKKNFLTAFPLTIFVKVFKSTYFELIVQNFDSSLVKTTALILVLSERF